MYPRQNLVYLPSVLIQVLAAERTKPKLARQYCHIFPSKTPDPRGEEL